MQSHFSLQYMYSNIRFDQVLVKPFHYNHCWFVDANSVYEGPTVITTDMLKQPSNLAVLGEMSCGIVENFSKRSRSLQEYWWNAEGIKTDLTNTSWRV